MAVGKAALFERWRTSSGVPAVRSPPATSPSALGPCAAGTPPGTCSGRWRTPLGARAPHRGAPRMGGGTPTCLLHPSSSMGSWHWTGCERLPGRPCNRIPYVTNQPKQTPEVTDPSGRGGRVGLSAHMPTRSKNKVEVNKKWKSRINMPPSSTSLQLHLTGVVCAGCCRPPGGIAWAHIVSALQLTWQRPTSRLRNVSAMSSSGVTAWVGARSSAYVNGRNAGRQGQQQKAPHLEGVVEA